LERGVNPATVAELVGHKDLTMIMRVYNQLKQRTDHLREAVRQARPEAASAPPQPAPAP
jgi:integrase